MCGTVILQAASIRNGEVPHLGEGFEGLGRAWIKVGLGKGLEGRTADFAGHECVER